MNHQQLPLLEPLDSEFKKGVHDPKLYFCYNCKSKGPKLINEYDDSWVCRKCLHQIHTQMQAYRNNRTETYPEINQILQNLYLGNEDAAINKQILNSCNIGAIMTCGVYLSSPFKQHYSYKVYNIMDDPAQQIQHLFDDSYSWIKDMHQQGKNVYVHCAAGVSRSASFVIAFIIKQKGITYEQALEFVRKRRNCILPNSGFKKQLYQYSKKLHTQKKQ